MTQRFLVAAVFLAGCAVGGVSGQLVVPKASAQQAATLTKWEFACAAAPAPADVNGFVNKFGQEGWELATVDSNAGEADVYCFKRPKM